MRNIIRNRTEKKELSRGVALYIAITITGALVLVAFSIVNLALRQINITAVGRDSQVAFYAADSGIECALYWDVKNPSGSAFATSSNDTITCNFNASNPDNEDIMPIRTASGNYGTSTFDISFVSATQSYCAKVAVVKSYAGGLQKTKIESRGYNTCKTGALRRVERAIRVNY